MKDSFSKRRFYLNKKEKNNSSEQNFTKEKDTFLKYEYKNKGKETNLEKNVNRLNKERIQIKNEFDKQKAVKNFIFFSNETEPKDNQKDINKNKKYFQFSRPNKILFTPNDYINASNKIIIIFRKINIIKILAEIIIINLLKLIKPLLKKNKQKIIIKI